MESLSRHTDYGRQALAESHLLADPIAQLQAWLMEAEQHPIYEPNAFVLSTVDATGHPTSRTVLLKSVDEQGLFFATNFESRKGRAIDSTGRVSAVFGWYPMHRQVLIDGLAVRAADAESDAYFASRPRGSQLGAWASAQSQPAADRKVIEAAYAAVEAEYEGREIPRPPFWGGYRIQPLRMEFWAGRTSRLHDRIEFARDSIGAPWQVRRLQP